MIFYKVRRKSDGQFYPFGSKSETFFRMPYKAVEMFNYAGWDGDFDKALNKWRQQKFHYSWQGETEEKYLAYLKARAVYTEIELVKFGPGGEIVCWTGSRCELTKKELDAMQPGGVAPLTKKQKQAGIRDEIGPLLDKIEHTRAKLGKDKSIDIDLLLSEIDLKTSKLKAAADELQQQTDLLRADIEKIYVQ